MAVAKNHELDWLPTGWKVEDKVKNGRKVRCFINVKSSQRLYSKASVLREIRKSRADSRGSHSQLSNGPLTRSLRNKEITIPTEPNGCHDSLPPGWITEVKKRKSGTRAGEEYKIYIEPSTGKMFYSKPEVTKYLKGKGQSTGSSERKKSDAMVDSSIKGSGRILRRHRPDQGEEVAPHPKFNEGKSVEVAQHPKSKEGKSVEVARHPKSKEGKSEEVPQQPKGDEEKTKVLSWDPKFNEGKREMVPRDSKLDERKEQEVPQCRKVDEGKAEEATKDPNSDEGKKEEVPQDPNFDEGKKSQSSKKRKGPVRVLRRHKPDQGEGLTPHPKVDEGKSEEMPQHLKFDEQNTKESPQDPNFDDGKREMVPLHRKLDERRKEEVPQDPNFDEGKNNQPSKKRKGSVRVLRRHKPDQGEEVALHPKFDEGKREEVPQNPNFHDGKTKELPWDPNFDEGKREMVVHAKLDESKKEEVPQHLKFDEGKAGEVPQHPIFDAEKAGEVLQHPFFDEEKRDAPQDPKFDNGKKSQPSKKRKAIVKTEIAEGLPPGWIKEIRIKESSNGVRKDPFYFNPTSGYVFRSRLEVHRYLETGEVSKHAYKRRDSGRNIIQPAQESPSDSTVRSNTTEDSIKRQLFTGEKGPKQSSLPCDYSEAGNNPLLDLGADVDTIPIEVQKPKGNGVLVVRSDTEPTSSLKDIFLEKKHEVSNKANTLAVETKPATPLSTNEFSAVELSKDKDETGKWSTEREPKRNRNEMDSSRRSSKRLAGIEIDHVTHSVAIEKVLRSANRKSDKIEAEQSQKESICHYNSESVTDVFGEEQSKDREEIGKGNFERKPKRNKKKIFEGIEVDPVSSPMSTGRVLRSAIKMSANTEAMPTLRSEQGEQAQEAPQATNVSSQEEIVRHYTEPATVPSKYELLGAEQIKGKEETVHQYTEPATVPSKNEKRRAERKPRRNRKQIVSPHRSPKLLAGIREEPVSHSMTKQRVLQSPRTEAMPSGSKQSQQAQESLLVINSQGNSVPAASIFPEEQTAKASPRSKGTHQTMMIDFSRNNIGGQTTMEPARNNFTDHMFKEPPKINSKERFSTDELTNRREKEQQDSPFSFPWSDPCIEFAYKTLTGALPLDDTVAIHDYVQHQIRTCSNSSDNNFTLQDSRPPGFSLNTVPSNSSNSITFPDPGPPGFSRGSAPSNRNDNFALPEARPPGFQKPSNSCNTPTFPDTTPPGFSFNASPSNRGNNLTLPDARPPGFSLNDIPSDCGKNNTFPDAMPPGFSLNDIPTNCGNSIAFPDATPPGFSLNDVPANRGSNLAFPDATPPGFSLNGIPSNCGNSITFPDPGPPGFSRSSVPSNSSNNLGISDGTPPGFSRSSVPSNRSDNFALPEARSTGSSQSRVILNKSNNFSIPDNKPPGFSRSSVLSNSNDRFVIPDTRSNGFSLNSAPSKNTDQFALPDARPPGFSLNSAPSSSNNDHFALPDVRQPDICRNSVPSNSNNDRFALPDVRQHDFCRNSVPSNSNYGNFALPDARRTGFPWSSNRVPSNSSENPALPDANSPGFSWSGFPLDGGINLNVAFTDDGPPGFSEKIAPSSKQQQQDVNPAAPHTQAADFPLQGTMFSSWNRNLR